MSNGVSDFKSTYLRAPKELDDKIADSERSPRVYFLVSILSKNIYGARRKSILKFTSFELKEPTFKTGIALTEILDASYVRIPVRVPAVLPSVWLGRRLGAHGVAPLGAV